MFLQSLFLGFILAESLKEEIQMLSDIIINHPRSSDGCSFPLGNILTNCDEVYEYLYANKGPFNNFGLYSYESIVAKYFFYHLGNYKFAREKYLTEEIIYNCLISTRTFFYFVSIMNPDAKINGLLENVFELLMNKSGIVFSEEERYPEEAEGHKEETEGSSLNPTNPTNGETLKMMERCVDSAEIIKNRLECLTNALKSMLSARGNNCEPSEEEVKAAEEAEKA